MNKLLFVHLHLDPVACQILLLLLQRQFDCHKCDTTSAMERAYAALAAIVAAAAVAPEGAAWTEPSKGSLLSACKSPRPPCSLPPCDWQRSYMAALTARLPVQWSETSGCSWRPTVAVGWQQHSVHHRLPGNLSGQRAVVTHTRGDRHTFNDQLRQL